MATPRISAAVHRLTDVFQREPERELSLADVERLTGLDQAACAIVLATLEDAHVLTRGRNGRFTRGDRHPDASR